MVRLHCGAVGSTDVLQQKGAGFISQPRVFSNGVCIFSMCISGFTLSSLFEKTKVPFCFKAEAAAESLWLFTTSQVERCINIGIMVGSRIGSIFPYYLVPPITCIILYGFYVVFLSINIIFYLSGSHINQTEYCISF